MKHYGVPEIVKTEHGPMVVSAPDIIAMTLGVFVQLLPPGYVHVHGESALVFGVAGQGFGRVAYWLTAWDQRERCLVLVRGQLPEDCDACRGWVCGAVNDAGDHVCELAAGHEGGHK